MEFDAVIQKILQKRTGFEAMVIGRAQAGQLFSSSAIWHHFAMKDFLHPRLVGVVASYGCWPFENESLDVIVIENTLAHLSLEAASCLLKECQRVLRHDGLLLMVDQRLNCKISLFKVVNLLNDQGFLVKRSFFSLLTFNFKNQRLFHWLGRVCPLLIRSYLLQVVKHNVTGTPVPLKWRARLAVSSKVGAMTRKEKHEG